MGIVGEMDDRMTKSDRVTNRDTGCKSEEELGIDDPVDSFLAVEHGAED